MFRGRRTFSFYLLGALIALISLFLMNLNVCLYMYRIYNINNLFLLKYAQPVQLIQAFASRDKAVGSGM